MIFDPANKNSVGSAALDSVPAHIAVLTPDGTVSTVNLGWRNFARANGFDGESGIGTNYIEICEQATGTGAGDARMVGAGIRAVLNGDVPTFEIEYPCHSPTKKRWFRAMVIPLGGDPGAGAVVTHVDVSERILAELALKDLNRDLGERIKEISALHHISNLLRDDSLPMRSLLERITEILVGSVQFPARASARVSLFDQETATPGFVTSSKFVRADLVLPDGSTGVLEITYPDTPPVAEEEFLPEESQMLESMAEIVRTTFDGRLAKERLTTTNQRFERQLEELGKLSGSGILDSDDLGETLRHITEVVSKTLDVERVSVWVISHSRSRIAARDLYSAKAGSHQADQELMRVDYPGYFKAIESASLIIAIDAQTHADTREFAESYLQPLGITSMLDAPIVVEGLVTGVLCLEHVGPIRTWTNDEQSFTLSLANLISLVLARHAHRASEESLAKAQEIAHLGSWQLDLRKNELTWSDETFRIFGLTPNEFGASFEAFLKCVYPDDQPAVLLAQDRSINDIEKLNIEFRIVRPDGEIRWVHELGEISRTESGEPLCHTGTVLDITARKTAEDEMLRRSDELRKANEQLAVSQTLLQIAGRAAKLGGWTIKLPEKELTWSDEICIIHDVPPGYLPTLDEGMGYYPAPNREEIARLVDECSTNGTPYDVVLRKQTALGRKIWVRTMGSAVRDEAGKIIGLQGATQDITAQKEAEESLAESQRRFRHLAESMPFIVWTASPSGELNFANRRFFEYLGIPSGSVPSAWYDAVNPSDRRKVAAEWNQTVERKSSYDTEYRVKRGSDEAYRWFRVQAEPIKDASGVIATWYGTAIDIHETKQLELNATRLANRLTATLESITDGFYTVDKDWKFTYVNSRAEALILRSRTGLIGKSVWDEFPHAVGTEIETSYRRAVSDGVPVEFETFFPPLETWFDIKAYPSDEGLSVYFSDITSVREHRERMRESEERFQLLAKATNDAIWDWNLIDDTLWWNEGFEEMFGFSRDEIEPTIDSWTNRIHPDDKERVTSGVRAAIKGGVDSWVDEYRFARKKGGYAFVLDRGYVIHDASGKAVRMIGGMTDLTERKNLEEQLLQSQKMEAVGQLAGGIAHDFNNLLTVINGYSQMLLRRDFGDERAKSALSGIHDAGKRAESLTSQLLAFSRRQPLNPSVVNLNDLLGSLWTMIGRLIGDDIELDSRLPDGTSSVKVDPGQFEQVLINLAVNARDAMPTGGHLLIETRNIYLDEAYRDQHPEIRPGNYVVTSVSDTGVGMSEEVKVRIFEPFFTTKLVGKGTGLGLATVFGIVKQSGGHISVYSELGHGTTFNIYLPAVEAIVSKSDERDIHQSETPSGNEIILLVEDSQSVRTMLKQALDDCGYRVFEAHDGRHALEVLEGLKDKPHIVVSDEVMPRLRGHELAAKIRELQPECKILLMSGYTEDSVLRRGILDAELPFMQKPFTPSALARKVRDVLDS